jgi:hypothetical protein
MDGFEATRRIRADEAQATSGRRGANPLPIVALTANATSGDRERCLAAGMSDHVPKPINPKLLLQKIEALTARRSDGGRCETDGGTTAEGGGAQVQASSAAPIDSASLLARCLGNTDLVLRLLAVFEPDFAHAIKGSAANLSADALANLARELEAAARQGQWQSRGELIRRIRSEFRRCVEALPALSATV